VVAAASTILLANLSGERRDEVARIADLDALLTAQLAAGRTEWPSVAVDDALYLGHLADKIVQRAAEPADHVIRSMPGGCLYLAAACTAGDERAIAAFRDTILPGLRPALGKLALSETTIDEALQRVLVMILVGDPVRPAIAGYSGRGSLRSWVRSIGVRTARRLAGVTEGGAHSAEDELDQIGANVHDPELTLLRERYRDKVREALADAFTRLTKRQRNVLRQYYIDGLTIDQLATLYKVDRATTARWVIGARPHVLEGMRDRLRELLGVSSDEVESILRLVRSQLDFSLRLLG
jgi:RNA polymerase sigma-70 factor (ECF subfamily)